MTYHDLTLACSFCQGFGDNANPSYAGQGLKGHPAIDEKCGYGSMIKPYKRICVYKVLDVAHPANDGSGFTGVFGIDPDGNEWLYGHCNPTAVIGRWYETTDVIGTEANHGLVYQDGSEITLAMQQAGDERGAHRHVQYRECQRTLTLSATTNYLSGMNGAAYRDAAGNYYAVPNFTNGFNGCRDWTTIPGLLNDPDPLQLDNLSKQVSIASQIVQKLAQLIGLRKGGDNSSQAR